MKSLVKYLLLLLAVGLLLPAATLAVQQVPPYPAAFWLVGTLNQPVPDSTPYKVVFYKTSDLNYAAGYSNALTDAASEILVNAQGDLLLLPLISGSGIYNVGVVKKKAANSKYYGVDATPIQFTAAELQNGYKSINLTLVEGQGIPDPSAPVGTLPLTITRDGTNIKIAWDPAIANPPVYMLAGDGTGKYVNDGLPPWVPVTDSSVKDQFDDVTAPGLSDGLLVHNNQVGTGAKEVYYKALKPGIDPAATNPDPAQNPDTLTYLAQARAIGKVNLELTANEVKLINSSVVDGKVSEALPGQLKKNEGILLYPRLDTGLDVTTIAVDNSNNQIFSGNNFDLLPTVGFWIKNTSTGTLTLTLCGPIGGVYIKDLATLDLTGNPICSPLLNTVLGGEDGDIAYKQLGSGLTPYTRSSGIWPGDLSLGLKDGFWYKTVSGQRYWDIDSPNTQAVIKSH